jgi:hypothetical protein
MFSLIIKPMSGFFCLEQAISEKVKTKLFDLISGCFIEN